MTLILSEEDVMGLLEMKEVVGAVEEAFRHEGNGGASNSVRTRSRSHSSVLSVMHASLPYVGRGGLKAYMSSKEGVNFLVVLFDESSSSPLAIMGADIIGRFRTGAAAAVATKYLFRGRSFVLALCVSGKQALTQVLAIQAIANLERVEVWSPNPAHRKSFVALLQKRGFNARANEAPDHAIRRADVVSSITSSRKPFLTERSLKSVSHVNLSGSNDPECAEATAGAVRSFESVVIDDIPQARVEYGDLIQAFIAGRFRWENAIQLSDVVSGKVTPKGRSLFKSGGAALEDVAVASLLYDKAMKSGKNYTHAELF
jgi:ornithine cyclodeaminase/alanine dehydrogenase-like protein (mu-crystallin family)